MIVVFTHTNKPGYRPTLDTLNRQTMAEDIIWMISSEENLKRSFLDRELKIADVYTLKTKRNSPHGAWISDNYNIGLKYARSVFNADLFISLQDYIEVPEDGVERFYNLSKQYPKALLTGLTSLSSTPDESWIEDINNLYDIFKPNYPRPNMSELSWLDCRSEMNVPDENGLTFVHAMEWEMNWSAIPKSAIDNTEIQFNPAYNLGIGYENQDYAAQCFYNWNYEIILDHNNHAIGYPHTKYWPEEKIRREQLGEVNRTIMYDLWGW